MSPPQSSDAKNLMIAGKRQTVNSSNISRKIRHIFLFPGCLNNQKKPTKTLLEVINEFSGVTAKKTQSLKPTELLQQVCTEHRVQTKGTFR